MSDINSTKQCTKCKNIKPFSDFYKAPKHKDGLRYGCKACSRAYANREDAKLTRAKYQKTDAGKLAHSKGNAKYSKTHAGKFTMVKYKSANPVKWKAQNIIGGAIRRGRIERPDSCDECPSTNKIEAHHDDYSLPLDVRWLCQLCHNAWHVKNGPGMNG